MSYQQELTANALRVYELEWDHGGQLVSETLNGTTDTFSYDDANQLVERQRGDEVWSWTYNTRGLITHTFSDTDAGVEARVTNFDADGRPTTATSHWTNGWVVPASYEHDADGRLTTALLASTPVFDASYDVRGLPTEVTAHWDGEARTTGRVYDGDGYLVGLDPGTGTQPITWDRSRAAGDVLATNTYGSREGLVSYLQGPAGAVGVHYGAVWLGGVNRDAQGSSLNHVGLAGYDPWGKPEGVAAPGRFGLGYRGELTIDGIVHLRNRDYHPGLNTFTSPDPLSGVPATPTVNSRYHYADNNPLNRIDPLGLRPDDYSFEPVPEHIPRSERLCGASTTLNRTRFGSHDAFIAEVTRYVEAGEAVHLRLLVGMDGYQGVYEDRCGDEYLTHRREFLAQLPAPFPHVEPLPPHPGFGWRPFVEALGLTPIGVVTDGGLCIGSVVTGNWGDAGFDCVAVLPPGDALRLARRADDAADAARTLRRACSFAGDTQVLMADGDRKPISEVEVGDLVLATDPETGETGPREVVATLPHTDQLLTLETSAGEIVTTEDHEYWNLTDREWQESRHLDDGDRLLTADGDEATVKGLDWTTVHTAPAYDLTIDDIHTFYVAAGTEDVLVHNCGPNGVFEASSKHHPNAGPRIGASPKNGQAALDVSVQVKPTSARRVAYSSGEFVVLDETSSGVFHGHVRSWGQLTQQMRNALVRAGTVDRRGRPL